MDLQNCVQHMMKVGLKEPVATALCQILIDVAPGDGPLPDTVDGAAAAAIEALAEPAVEAEAAADLIVKSIENAIPARQAIRKSYVGEMKALKNGDIEAYVSTEAVDRVGDVIKAKGWSLDNFKRTGAPVLFSHDYAQPPIGKAVEMEVQRKGLWSVTRFHEKTQMSRDLAKLARDGDMRSWSVGFNPLEDPEMRKDDKGNFAGYIFNKSELLEYSLVAVPANPEAVSKAIKLAQRGIISHQMAVIIAGPSPMADQGIAETFAANAQRTQHERDAIQAKTLANKFMKGILNVRRG
jgi:HK97 family phage prohead protease